MIVSPSLLSADFGYMAKELEMLANSEADMLHIDIMDGMFVPNITIGFPVMKRISELTDKPLDVHLMILEPQKYVQQVKDAGGAIMTIHYEACTHLHRTLGQIKAAGMKTGVAIIPSTPVSFLSDIINDIDIVTIMSVNPGFSGQTFIENSCNKVKELKKLIVEKKANTLIEVDGGINNITGKKVAEAGADIVVAGNYIFKSENPLEAIKTLHLL